MGKLTDLIVIQSPVGIDEFPEGPFKKGAIETLGKVETEKGLHDGSSQCPVYGAQKHTGKGMLPTLPTNKRPSSSTTTVATVILLFRTPST